MAATFGDMMARFVREAIASGNLSAIMPSTPTSASTAPLPTLPVPPAAPYTSTRSLALPAAATGHPIPSNIPATVPAQPMLGVAGLALPLASGHTNNPRRTRVSDVLTAKQISQTNTGRMAAARAHLGSGSEEQLVRRGRRRRGPAAHPPVLHAGPQTVLDKVSSVSAVGERHIRVTHVVQPYQEGLEVIQYKNYREAHFHYLSGGDLTMDYDLLDTTRVSDILQMSARNMTVGPRQITFGRLSAGPSTRLQHEMLDLQVLVYVNNAKNRRNGTAHLRREALSANLTLADLFVPPLKAQYPLPTHCVHNGRFLLHSIIRSPGATFIETLSGSLPRQHRCLTLRHNKQFNEAVEMNWDSSDDEGSTSGGVSAPEFDDEDIENFVPSAPALTAVTRPQGLFPLRYSSIGDQGVAVAGEASMDIGGEQEMVPDSTRINQVSSSSSTPAGSTAVMPPTQRAIVSTTTLPSQPVTAITPPWPTSSWIPAPATLYRELHERNDVTAAIYQAATDGGTLELRGGSIDELAEAYIASVREAAARRDFSPLLRVRRRFQIVGPAGEISSFGSGIEAETIHKALDRFLNEDRLSLGISVPMSMRFGVTSARLDDLRVFGAMLSRSLICGHGVGDISPALIQYCLNQCNLESLTPSVISSWHPSLDRAARQLQAVGSGGNLTPFQDKIVGTLGIQLPALKGWSFPAQNGFSFGKFARSFPGGTEFFLAHHWTSYISDFASLEPHMLITAP
ncbi:hypothetical protein R3P38DRAFT_3588516 [Favolaschia claudopus]|uniref:HECT domain-containing protein n=1 Tax=Favolaschia claudopus TaxID=2862362 RepID=A0AAW0AKI5_9AGAR